MDRIELDSEALREDAAWVERTRESITAAAGVLALLADAIAQPELSSAARELSEHWEDARSALEADAGAAAEALRAIADIAAGIDAELAASAAALRGTAEDG